MATCLVCLWEDPFLDSGLVLSMGFLMERLQSNNSVRYRLDCEI